jgi:hypothetical protein
VHCSIGNGLVGKNKGLYTVITSLFPHYFPELRHGSSFDDEMHRDYCDGLAVEVVEVEVMSEILSRMKLFPKREISCLGADMSKLLLIIVVMLATRELRLSWALDAVTRLSLRNSTLQMVGLRRDICLWAMSQHVVEGLC